MKEYIDTDVSIKQHSIQSIIDAWNQLEPYGIKMIYRINPGSKRCTSLIALLEQFGEEKVIQAVDKVKQSDFLQGKTDARFSLNFDWFINPNNFVKVLEGKYDERHDKKPATKNNNNFERRHYDMQYSVEMDGKSDGQSKLTVLTALALRSGNLVEITLTGQILAVRYLTARSHLQKLHRRELQTASRNTLSMLSLLIS